MTDFVSRNVGREEPFSGEEIGAVVRDLINPDVGAERKADFLIGMSKRGERPAEIAEFAKAFLGLAVPVPGLEALRDRELVLDVCGTGGDRLNTFNISTTVALVLAAEGVAVAKHGNRAVTSQSGSADVLEALGISIHVSADQAAGILQQHRFVFFLASNYHPAFRVIGPARKLCAERGKPTLFNFLGPLLNPARPTAQLMGVARVPLCPVLAEVLQSLGVRRGMVISGEIEGRQLDEFSVNGPTTVVEFYQQHGISNSVFASEDLVSGRWTLDSLSGGSAADNAVLIERILTGREAGARLEAVLLNSAAALLVSGRVRSMSEGWERARLLVASGKVWEKVESLRKAIPAGIR